LNKKGVSMKRLVLMVLALFGINLMYGMEKTEEMLVFNPSLGKTFPLSSQVHTEKIILYNSADVPLYAAWYTVSDNKVRVEETVYRIEAKDEQEINYITVADLYITAYEDLLREDLKLQTVIVPSGNRQKRFMGIKPQSVNEEIAGRKSDTYNWSWKSFFPFTSEYDDSELYRSHIKIPFAPIRIRATDLCDGGARMYEVGVAEKRNNEGNVFEQTIIFRSYITLSNTTNSAVYTRWYFANNPALTKQLPSLKFDSQQQAFSMQPLPSFLQKEQGRLLISLTSKDLSVSNFKAFSKMPDEINVRKGGTNYAAGWSEQNAKAHGTKAVFKNFNQSNPNGFIQGFYTIKLSKRGTLSCVSGKISALNQGIKRGTELIGGAVQAIGTSIQGGVKHVLNVVSYVLKAGETIYTQSKEIIQKATQERRIPIKNKTRKKLYYQWITLNPLKKSFEKVGDIGELGDNENEVWAIEDKRPSLIGKALGSAGLFDIQLLIFDEEFNNNYEYNTENIQRLNLVPLDSDTDIKNSEKFASHAVRKSFIYSRIGLATSIYEIYSSQDQTRLHMKSTVGQMTFYNRSGTKVTINVMNGQKEIESYEVANSEEKEIDISLEKIVIGIMAHDLPSLELIKPEVGVYNIVRTGEGLRLKKVSSQEMALLMLRTIKENNFNLTEVKGELTLRAEDETDWKIALESRRSFVKEKIEALNPEGNNKGLKIAVACGGGGYRAGIELLGWLKGAQDNFKDTQVSLLDCVTYVGGLSGSSWTLLAWLASNLSVAEYLNTFSEGTTESILSKDSFTLKKLTGEGLENYNQMRRKKIAYGQDHGFVGRYGATIAQGLLLNQKNPQVYSLSHLQAACNTGQFPLPIVVALNHKRSKEKSAYEWFEINPYFAKRCEEALVAPIELVGSVWKDGEVIRREPEHPASYHMGYLGSAFSLDAHALKFELNKKIGLAGMLVAPIIDYLKDDSAYAASSIPNFYYGKNGDTDLDLHLVDGGLKLVKLKDEKIVHANLATMPFLLRDDVDMLIICDPDRNKNGIRFLRAALQEAQTLRPTGIISPISDDWCNGLQHLVWAVEEEENKDKNYVSIKYHQTKKKALVYMHAKKLTGSEDAFDPSTQSFTKTENFKYTRKQVAQLSGLTASQMEQAMNRREQGAGPSIKELIEWLGEVPQGQIQQNGNNNQQNRQEDVPGQDPVIKQQGNGPSIPYRYGKQTHHNDTNKQENQEPNNEQNAWTFWSVVALPFKAVWWVVSAPFKLIGWLLS
jgi:hypothetical protein